MFMFLPMAFEGSGRKTSVYACPTFESEFTKSEIKYRNTTQET